MPGVVWSHRQLLVLVVGLMVGLVVGLVWVLVEGGGMVAEYPEIKSRFCLLSGSMQ